MKKTQIIILAVLTLIIILLSAVFITVLLKVDSVKYNITAAFEPYEYRDGLLVSKKGDKAMRFITNMGTYRELEIGIFNPADYDGAEGLMLSEVTACVNSKNLIPISGNAFPYYNLDGCFVYGKKGEEKYLVDTEARTVSPLISRSSINIEGICTNGEFMLENDGQTVTVLRRKDRTSNEIISEKQVEFGESYTDVTFVAWYNERYALVRLNKPMTTTFGLIDGVSGEFTALVTTNDVPALLMPGDGEDDGRVQCFNTLIGGRFLQCYEIEPSALSGESEQVKSGKYLDIFSGAIYDTRLNREVFVGKNELVAVSDDGSYAVFKTALKENHAGSIEYVIFNSDNGKYCIMGEILGDEAFIDDIYFTYSNVMFVNYAEINTGTEAACSIKLSF